MTKSGRFNDVHFGTFIDSEMVSQRNPRPVAPRFEGPSRSPVAEVWNWLDFVVCSHRTLNSEDGLTDDSLVEADPIICVKVCRGC